MPLSGRFGVLCRRLEDPTLTACSRILTMMPFERTQNHCWLLGCYSDSLGCVCSDRFTNILRSRIGGIFGGAGRWSMMLKVVMWAIMSEEYLSGKSKRPRSRIDCLRRRFRLIGGNLNTMTGVWGSQFMPAIDMETSCLSKTVSRTLQRLRSSSFLKLNGGLLLPVPL